MVVRVGCSTCGRPLGVAIVGTGPKAKETKEKGPFDWTKRDCEKFAGKPAITYDDVLEAHQFFSELGSDWSKHLPRAGRASNG